MGKDRDDDSAGPLSKVYVPKYPIFFHKEHRTVTIFESSDYLKRVPYITMPSYFLSFASCYLMMNSLASMSYFKATLFTFPFVSLLFFATYATQQTSLIISKIELLQDCTIVPEEPEAEVDKDK